MSIQIARYIFTVDLGESSEGSVSTWLDFECWTNVAMRVHNTRKGTMMWR